MLKLSKWEAVKINLWKQHLFHPSDLETKEDMIQLLLQLGCVQLDTLNVVTRNHNLVFWSRMKHYQESFFYDLYHENRVFKCYVHALSLLPMEEYPYWISSFKDFQAKVMEKSDEIDYLLEVYNVIKKNYSISTYELTQKLNQTQGSKLQAWEMSPVRWATDCLWRSGLIRVKRKNNFNKVYFDNTNRIEENICKQPVSTNDIYSRYVRKAFKAMGAATDKDISDYFRLSLTTVREMINRLLSNGRIIRVELEGCNDQHYLLKEDYDFINSSSFQEEPTHCTFLSPFDNLIWYRHRMSRMSDVDYRLESYIPKTRRKYGYFALPILLKGEIVGTIDLKLERKDKLLIIKKLVLFNPVEYDQYAFDIANILKNLLRFLDAETTVDESNSDELVRKVMAHM